MKNSANIFGALILGVAAGVAVGILIAPDKGTETRKRLLGKAQDLGDSFKNRLTASLDKFEEVKEMAEEKINNLKGQAKSTTTKTESSVA